MKAIAIRLKSNKEPVMVLGGHYNQWTENDLFWAIDECVNPNECEFINFEIEKWQFCISWPQQLEEYADSDKNYFDLSNSVIGNDLMFNLDNVFSIENGWIEISIFPDGIFPAGNYFQKIK